jgi:hypothetical protein
MRSSQPFLWYYYVASLPDITHSGGASDAGDTRAAHGSMFSNAETDGECDEIVPLLSLVWNRARGSDAEVAAMVEQVKQECLAIVFHGDVRGAGHAVGEREDSLSDAQISLIHETRLAQGIQHG